VLYDEASRARILEEERWAAPLKSEIRQSIGEKVRHLLREPSRFVRKYTLRIKNIRTITLLNLY
jgi:uncharacterized lipoprotein YmbA